MFKKIFKNRKGQSLSSLWVAGLGLVILTIVMTIGSKILAQMKAGETDPNATALIDTGFTGLLTLGDWIPIVALAVAGVLVLSLIIRSFGGLSRAV